MATFTGTNASEIITTTLISVSVVRNPAGTLPGAGTDVINAGGGNDFVNAGGGNDIVDLGAGDDTFEWNLGDGPDIIEGRTNTDVLRVNGSADGQVFVIGAAEGPDFGRTLLSDSSGALVNFNDIEIVQFRPLDGEDLVAVTNLFGTDVSKVDVDLSGADGAPDNDADTVTAAGSEGNDVISATGVGNLVRVSGLRPELTIANADFGKDKLFIKGFGGDDRLDASALPANMMLVAMNGGDDDDTLIGSAGNDELSGDGGDDTLTGGAGADVLTGSNFLRATENDTASYATSAAAVNVSLATQTGVGGDAEGDTLIEIDRLVGSAFADTLTGNEVVNLLNGLDGDDTLDGGTGADTMAGGAGNDTYLVDNGGDRTVEADGAGTDSVRSLISFALAANVENLTLLDAAAISGTGNDLGNTLVGNGAANALSGLAGKDRIDGGAGADTMAGGVDNDTYIVDDVADVVVEDAGAGIDRVLSSVSFNLAANVEKLTLTGSAEIDGTGNGLSNIIVGNVAANLLIGELGNDRLNGGAGVDTMRGGKGNDIYFADRSKDVAIEASGQGIDKVVSTASFKLGANVEHMTLTGAAKISGTGNGLANVITGNGKANVLTGLGGNDRLSGGAGNDGLDGGAGNDRLTGGGGNDAMKGGSGNDRLDGGAANDTLSGGAGKDLLIGGSGKDAFVFNTGLDAKTNVDTIVGFSVPNDTIRLDDAIFKAIGAGLSAGEFFVGASAHDANDRIIYNETSGALTYDSNGDAAGGATLFARMGGGLALTHQDFLIV